jgi:hypothetical protein
MARTQRQNEWANSDRGKAYNVWRNIMYKCSDPKHVNYRHYGGRGIEVDARWHIFDRFYADMGPAPAGMTIERIDNALGYSPQNCRWASRRDQARNRRSNRLLTLDDTTQCVAAWSEQTGIKRTTILQRLDAYGWPIERALRRVI